jgi:hypothetical protein
MVDVVKLDQAGLRGAGAYEYWIAEGNVGTVQQYLDAQEAAAAAQVALAVTAKEGAEAASAAAQSAVFGLSYSSVRCPPENGELSTSGENGGLYLPNSSNLFKTTVANDTPFFNADGAFAVICTVPVEQYDQLKRLPYIVATTDSTTSSRAIQIGYIPRGYSDGGVANANQGKFTFSARGETANGTASAVSAAMPSNFSGRALVVIRRITNDIIVDVWDLDTGVKTAGTLTALPGSWAGVDRFTNNLSLGIVNEALFPQQFAVQSINYWRGEIGDFVMADGATTDTQWGNIAGGAVIATELGAGNLRLHCPLVSGGAISYAVTSNKAAVVDTLALRGKLYPGSTIRKQAAATYLTIDRLTDPAPVSVLYTANGAELKLTGKFAGVTGRLQARALDATGRVVVDWVDIGPVPGSGTTWEEWIDLPLWVEALHIEVRATSAPTTVARVNTDVFVGYSIGEIGQSQIVFGLTGGTAPQLPAATGLSKTYDGGAAKNAFLIMKARIAGAIDNAVITRSRFQPGLAGDGFVEQINYLRRYTKYPIFIYNFGVTGTSCRDLMDDALSSRTWEDLEEIAAMGANRDRDGRYIVTGFVQNWASSDPITAYGAQILKPWLWGIQSDTQSGTFIAQADIDHFLYDGVTFNPSARFCMIPFNRSTGSTTQLGDGETQADIRKNQRESAETFGILLGPEITVHELEGGTLNRTHPSPTSENGVPVYARVLAEGGALAIGLGTYRGAASIDAATGASFTDGTRNVISVPITGPTGGSLHPFTVGTTAISGFEVQDGGAGSWTYAGFTGAIYTPRVIRLTKDSGSWLAGTKIRFHSGGPGGYGNWDDDAWIAGAPMWDGWEVQGDNTTYTVSG